MKRIWNEKRPAYGKAGNRFHNLYNDWWLFREPILLDYSPFNPAGSITERKQTLLPLYTTYLNVDYSIYLQWFKYISKYLQVSLNNMYKENHGN